MQPPQSGHQLGSSPHSGWQKPSPQTQPPQSGHQPGSSPHSGWQKPSPQNSSGVHSPPQSIGQLDWLSPHEGSQIPSPQKQSPQSGWQLKGSSPHWASHRPLPHAQLGTQRRVSGLHESAPPPWTQLSHTSPSFPQASSAVPGAQPPSGRQQPVSQAQASPPWPPAPGSGGPDVTEERPQPAITARRKAAA